MNYRLDVCSFKSHATSRPILSDDDKRLSYIVIYNVWVIKVTLSTTSCPEETCQSIFASNFANCWRFSKFFNRRT